MPGQGVGCAAKLLQGNVQPCGGVVEQSGRIRIDGRVGRQREVVRQVRALPVEARTFRRHRHPVGEANRVLGTALLDRGRTGGQTLLNLEDGPRERSGVAPVEHDRVETVEGEVAGEPVHSPAL